MKTSIRGRKIVIRLPNYRDSKSPDETLTGFTLAIHDK